MSMELKVKQLRESIDGLMDDIAGKVANDLLGDIDSLLRKRNAFLEELIAIPGLDDDKRELTDYLIHVRKRDGEMMKILLDDRDRVKSALLKCGQLKAYAES